MPNIKTLDQLIHKDYLDKDGEKVKISISEDNESLFVPYRITKKLFGKLDGIVIQSILPKYITIKFDEILQQVWIKEKCLNMKSPLRKKNLINFPFNEFLIIVGFNQNSIILMHTKYAFYWKVNLKNLANNLKKVYVNLKFWGTREKYEKFICSKDEVDLYTIKNQFRPAIEAQLKEKHGKIPTTALKDLKALELQLIKQKHLWLANGTIEEDAYKFRDLEWKVGPKIFDKARR